MRKWARIQAHVCWISKSALLNSNTTDSIRLLIMMGDILQIELSVYNTITMSAPAGDDF